ncbi:Ig-like domain-containing protein [Methanoplanus endosymbiosus]|uniref:Ig-like domain-containing protein n=1 Tax=Methanoplanus endosymbiosus TaxID=33865 RepID=A0A9E7PRZ7_9EURY|nr:Ig-like domain-containing protein [Methanoplanus endosymbiosus]UUX92557.1 Ig-like domain-containing protein [Methanoplanus endosymbiosus]
MKKIIIFLLALALLITAGSASDWEVDITYMVNSTSGFVTSFDELALGTKTSATDRYDEGIDTRAAPLNPDGNGQYIKVSGYSEKLYKAFCSPLSSEVTTKEWILYLVVGDKEEEATRAITLSWENSNVPEEISSITMKIGSDLKDMLTERQWSFSRDGDELTTKVYIYAEYGAETIPVFTTINITPESPSIVVGAKEIFNALPRDQSENIMDSAELNVVWSSSNTTVGAIDQSGCFTALAPGETTVTVSSEGVFGSITVTVSDNDGRGWADSITATEVTPTEAKPTESPLSGVYSVDENTQQFTATLDNNSVELISGNNSEAEVLETSTGDKSQNTGEVINNEDHVTANQSADKETPGFLFIPVIVALIIATLCSIYKR